MARNDAGKTGGVGFDELLQIALIILKLCGVINWSWWWVLSPLWISIIIAVIFFVIEKWR